MKKFILFFLLALSSIQLNAIDINGKIIEASTQKPIEFTIITLLNNDSSYVSHGETNENGIYSIVGKFRQGNYILRISCIGYMTTYMEIKNLSENIDLGTTLLKKDAYGLDQVEIKANRIINTADRQIILPNKFEIQTSSNGFDLLNRLSIPGLVIDPINKKISAYNENVQLRINGIKSTLIEVQALLPQDISRVEYLDEPGVRYADENVGAIINIITKRKKDTGGYISIDTNNALAVEFGNNQVSIKANHKSSQFSLDYQISYRGYDKRWSEGSGSYNFPNNQINYIEKGERRPMSYQTHDFNLSYNLTETDNYTLNISLKDNILNSNSVYANSLLYINENKQTNTYNKDKNKFNTPVLDIYYSKNLKNKQTITANIVGTYIKTDNNSIYRESEEDLDIENINKFNNGKKYSIIGEFLYNKEFSNKMILTTGGKHTQGYTKNSYRGSTISNNEMHSAESYLYCQIQGSIKNKVKYNIGLGAFRTWYKEEQNDKEYYMLRPSFNLSYKLNDKIDFRYSFNVNTITPSLGQLIDVEQEVNRFLVYRGNPNIKPYNNYSNNIRVSYNHQPINLSLYLYHRYMHKPFMRAEEIKNDKVYRFSDNFKSYQTFGGQIYASLDIIKDTWKIQGQIGSSRFLEKKDNSESFSYTNLYGNLGSYLLYKNYTLDVGMESRYNSLWSSSIYYGEKWSYIEAGYKYKESKLSAGISLPFDNYWSAGSKNKSKANPFKNWSYIKENSRMVYIKYAWNISFGKKYKTEDKILNNSDNDSGL